MAMVYLSAEGSLITISRQGNLYMTRNADVGLDQLQTTSPSDLSGEKPEKNEEAEELFEGLLLEIQRSLDYYEHQLGQPRANHVVIAPLEYDVPGLIEYLTENLSVNLRVLDLSEALATDHEIARDLQARCLTAIGGALRMDGP